MDMIWKSYSDFYRQSSYAVFPQEHRTSFGRLPFRMIHVDQGPHQFTDPRVSETVLALALSVESRCNWRWSIEGCSYSEVARPGCMLIVPAEVESQWDVDGARRMLVLTLPNETVQSILGTASSERIRQAFWTLAERVWDDPLVETLMLRLWDALENRQPLAGRLGDGIITTMLSHLLLRAGGSNESAPQVSLPRWRLKRVQDFVIDNLERSIGMDELAYVAGLSRRHFARSFAAELGVTPHKWLMMQRLDRAQELLAGTDDALSDIALACGFSSQSHLTSLMRQEAGITPHKWRQKHRH